MKIEEQIKEIKEVIQCQNLIGRDAMIFIAEHDLWKEFIQFHLKKEEEREKK